MLIHYILFIRGKKIMRHEMKLNNSPFVSIKNKTKTIELRLNDDKRQKINVGDEIEFINNMTSE